MHYLIDKRYKTRVQRSPRVLAIAEAFGLGLDDKEFVVFDNVELEINQGDVVYVTGQSGGGKSTVLRELQKAMIAEGLHVVDIDQLTMPEEPLTDQIGDTQKKGLEYLQQAGVSDANLFVRKPSELSDGQRYRFRLAKLLESGAKVWIADEFLAVLDRTSAKFIAFTLQKAARLVGATLIVATTHPDLREDLAPNLFIDKRYREKIKVERKQIVELSDTLAKNEAKYDPA